ncbi:hypothetical protein [Clostridium formicaceticum]|uniref:FMN-binding domain-containing protein n=1 Tax=Clostridium formicaceticum TaxID=1497 RepID=A0AAC9RJQ5_9CLOT|nr:hypothetical protein [Clostridium formicaceticum]AOY77766.1 hypothetical protein BJL90_19015 [Clostridium formicaceticum]ARE88369.1 hypothetical protein CLFO_27710 [Clostridium formicaceticum]
MKKLSMLMLALVLVFTAVACSANEANNTEAPKTDTALLAGRYVGYSWKGEANGTKFEDSNEYIETILELDENGIITDAKMGFFVLKDGYWISRQSGNAYVDVDFSVAPIPAVPGEDYKAGDSMFTVHTADMMSFYATAVDSTGVAAVAIVDPVTRYQYEMKFDKDFDFNTSVGEITIGSGMLVPTIRTSGGGLLKPSEWNSLADKTIFDISPWSHVINDVGVLEGISNDSSVKDFLAALGVEFNGDQPQQMAVEYGYFGLGGWKGNYDAIKASLIGQDATQLTSLVDWSNSRYAGAINEQNVFGVDVESGATKTVQNSFDGISGATVRISREATSYQRALVNAGILDESDVIIGRF